LCDLNVDGRVTEVFRGNATVESIVFSPDGKHLALGTRYHEVCLVALDGEVVKRIPSKAKLDSLEFMPRNSLLLVPNRISTETGETRYVQFWSSDLSKVNGTVFYPSEQESEISVARSSPCENYLVAGDHVRNDLFLFHLPSQRVVADVPAFRDNLMDLTYSPDGESLAAGYRNGAVQLLKVKAGGDTASVRSAGVYRAHAGEVMCTRFLSTKSLATCGSDGLIRIWNTSSDETRKPNSTGELWDGPRVVPWKRRLPTGVGTGIRLSPDGSQFLYLATSGIRGIDARTGSVIQSHAVPSSGSSEWSPAGDRIALCYKTGNARFEVSDRTGEAIMTVPRDVPPRAAAFSPLGDRIAIVDDRALQICSAHDGSELVRRPLNGPGSSIAFSHDGTQLACGGRFAGVQMLEPQSATVLRELAGGWDTNDLAFSPDDSLLAAAHGDDVIRLWETRTGHLQAELVGHESSVRDIAFSPDGRTLISASTDGTIRLWSVEYGRSFGTLYANRAECHISLSADGHHFAISYRDEHDAPRVLLWDHRSERSD
jgi:WD40 repeat protein